MSETGIGIETLTLFLTIASSLGVIFSVYLHFKNPQIKASEDSVKVREELDTLTKIVNEVKEKHLHEVQQDMKQLNTTINGLSITVAKLSTIIDERIPKAQNR